MAVGDTYVFPGFLTPVLTQLFFPKPPTTFLTCFCRGERRKYPSNNTLQYYVKREKCKVNDVIFPSGCEACAINLDNKNMKIGIFTGRTSVRSKNIFTAVSRYPTGKHEIKQNIRLPPILVSHVLT